MSDRRLWLADPCPSCGARSGLRCQTFRYHGKPTGVLHGARGWRHRSCPTCKAQPERLCRTPSGRQASQPHTARLQRGRRELLAEEQVWEELERWGAAAALVRFSGGGPSQGSVAAVTLESADKRELARWSSGEGELPEALAAPIWGRYGLFRGHPRITGLLMWEVPQRQVLVVGQRGGQKFDELLSAPPRQPVRLTVTTPEPTSLAVPSPRDTSPAAADPKEAPRSCERCGQPLTADLRPEARYCSKRCRQASSRARLKAHPPSPPPTPQQTCAWCERPMPADLRPEARYCSKRCRQASSRHAIASKRTAAGPHDASTQGAKKATGRSRHG